MERKNTAILTLVSLLVYALFSLLIFKLSPKNFLFFAILALLVVLAAAGLLIFRPWQKPSEDNEEQASQSEAALRSMALEQLLRGGISDNSLPRDLGGSIIPNSPTAVCVLTIEPSDINALLPQSGKSFQQNSPEPEQTDYSLSDSLLALSAIESVFSSRLSHPCVFSAFDGLFYCVVSSAFNTDFFDSDEPRAEFLSGLKEQLAEASRYGLELYGVGFSVVIGEVVPFPQELTRSYISAADLYAYSRLTGRKQDILTAGDLPPSSKAPARGSIVEREQKFYSDVLAGDYEKAAEVLSDIIDYELGRSVQSGSALKPNLIARVESIVSYAAGVSEALEPETAVSLREGASRLVDASTAGELKKAAGAIFDQLSGGLVMKNLPLDKAKNVSDYIAENYTRPELDMELICKELDISPHYLAKLMKEQHGVGVNDYIQSIRLDATKELLLSSRDTIESVAIQAGFQSRFILNRVFKKLEGITPSEYRDIHSPKA